MHDLAQAAELRTSVVKLRTSVAHSVKDICDHASINQPYAARV